MKRYIHITKENREFLMKAFGVSRKTVQNAVMYDGERGESDLAKRIRKLALAHGGIAMVASPEVETLFDSDGYMRQYFPNGAMLELSKKDASGDVFYKGENVKHYDHVAIQDIYAIQDYAQALK